MLMERCRVGVVEMEYRTELRCIGNHYVIKHIFFRWIREMKMSICICVRYEGLSNF